MYEVLCRKIVINIIIKYKHMMKKWKNILLFAVIALFLVGVSQVRAFEINAWLIKNNGSIDYVLPNDSAGVTMNAGDSSDRIPNIYGTNLNVTTATLGGVSSGAIIIDVTDPVAFQVRVDSDAGDVLTVNSTSPGVLLGGDGVDGQLGFYSEQGGTDYTATLFANTTMTSAASFYLPADEPAGTYLLNMTTGGVIGFDSSTYLTAETDPIVGAITGIVKADGASNIAAAVDGTDYISSVVADTTPQLAAALDAQTFKIVNLADPTNSQDAATMLFVENAVGFTFDYFFGDTSDAEAGIYYVMTDNDLGGAESDLTTVIGSTGSDKPLVNFLTPDGEPGVQELEAGIYEIHTHAEKTAGGSSVDSLYWELYKRASVGTGGAETLLGTSETSSAVTSKTEYNIHMSLASPVTILNTDRLLVKFYANLSGGAGATVVLSQEGTTASHFEFQTTSNILSNIFVRQDGTTDMSVATGNAFDIGLGGASGDDFTVDSTAFIVEGDTGNVGIGTNTPSAPLHIIPPDLNLERNSLAIGNFTPASNNSILHIQDSVTNINGVDIWLKNTSTATSSNTIIYLEADNGVVGMELLIDGLGNYYSTAGGYLDVYTNHPLMFHTNATERMRITAAGLVGIGTTPSSILHIKASIPGTIGDKPAGQLIIQSPTNDINTSTVITAYKSSAGGDPDIQLWYLGSSSSSNTNITFLNRQNGTLTLATNDTDRLTVSAAGAVDVIGAFTAGTIVSDGTISGSNLSGSNTGDQTLPVKATGAELDTGTDDAKFATAKALADSKYVLSDETATLTNKRITQRVVTTASDATAVIDIDVTDVYELTAMAAATTFTLTGTPTDGQKLMVRIKDDTTTRALTWTGFTPIGITLPANSTSGKWHYVGCTYNLGATAWHCVAVAEEA